eukprot:gene10582-7350_t
MKHCLGRPRRATPPPTTREALKNNNNNNNNIYVREREGNKPNQTTEKFNVMKVFKSPLLLLLSPLPLFRPINNNNDNSYNNNKGESNNNQHIILTTTTREWDARRTDAGQIDSSGTDRKRDTTAISHDILLALGRAATNEKRWATYNWSLAVPLSLFFSSFFFFPRIFFPPSIIIIRIIIFLLIFVLIIWRSKESTEKIVIITMYIYINMIHKNMIYKNEINMLSVDASSAPLSPTPSGTFNANERDTSKKKTNQKNQEKIITSGICTLLIVLCLTLCVSSDQIAGKKKQQQQQVVHHYSSGAGVAYLHPFLLARAPNSPAVSVPPYNRNEESWRSTAVPQFLLFFFFLLFCFLLNTNISSLLAHHILFFSFFLSFFFLLVVNSNSDFVAVAPYYYGLTTCFPPIPCSYKIENIWSGLIVAKQNTYYSHFLRIAGVYNAACIIYLFIYFRGGSLYHGKVTDTILVQFVPAPITTSSS